ASATVRALLYPSVCRDSSSPPSPIAIVGGASKRAEACGRDMAGRYDGGNPFEEEEDVNPFSEQTRGKAGGQSNYGGGGAFYMPVLRSLFCPPLNLGVKFALDCWLLTTVVR
uniref:Uncharacterized protein n=1 Tax=Aegilops tauschii subsp. strangulata TaxID=200361 RepID=A0A453BAL7_AEGTS